MSTMKLTEKGAKLISEGGVKLPAGITMAPSGIDLFAMMLHMVYAHTANPVYPRPDDSRRVFDENLQHATHYLRNDVTSKVRWKHQRHFGEDRMVHVYTLSHPRRGDDEIIIAIDPTHPRDTCLFLFLPATETFVQMDLTQIKLLNPA